MINSVEHSDVRARLKDVFDLFKAGQITQELAAELDREIYLNECLLKSPHFRAVYSEEKTEGTMTVFDPKYGYKPIFLQKTDDQTAKEILQNSRKAANVFGQFTLQQRLKFLEFFNEAIVRRENQIALTFIADTGKTIKLSRGEMTKGEAFFAHAAKNAQPQIASFVDFNYRDPTYYYKDGRNIHAGAGMVIGAFNFPFALAIPGIVGNLVAGNGLIVTATSKAMGWAFLLMDAGDEAIEKFKVWMRGDGNVPKKLCDAFDDIKLIQLCVGGNRRLSAEADHVHFIGGDDTGNKLKISRGDKPTVLEMGGSNFLVVMESAIDSVAAGNATEIANTIMGGLAATGQRCTAPRNLYVQNGAEAIVDEMIKFFQQGNDFHKAGNPYSEHTEMGPMVDAFAYRKIREAIALARELDAPVHGSLDCTDPRLPRKINDEVGPFWVNPVAIDWRNVSPSHPRFAELEKLWGEELFGPCLHILPQFADLNEAVSYIAKIDKHGLATAIFTGDVEGPNSEAEIYRQAMKGVVTSVNVNAAPKDKSPNGPHGHPFLDLHVGGPNFYQGYMNSGLTKERRLTFTQNRTSASEAHF